MTIHPSESWKSRAVCSDTSEPDIFFDGLRGKEKGREILDYCQVCPVVQECRDYGALYGLYGTWGGLSNSELKEYRKKNLLRLGYLEAKTGHLMSENSLPRAYLEEISDVLPDFRRRYNEH